MQQPTARQGIAAQRFDGERRGDDGEVQGLQAQLCRGDGNLDGVRRGQVERLLATFAFLAGGTVGLAIRLQVVGERLDIGIGAGAQGFLQPFAQGDQLGVAGHRLPLLADLQTLEDQRDTQHRRHGGRRATARRRQGGAGPVTELGEGLLPKGKGFVHANRLLAKGGDIRSRPTAIGRRTKSPGVR
ncbi:hypothetical protein Q3H58_000801 [Pseudomonas psychrotolerans]|nr:hypothetical protein [Pseudomonas psychrotolerans]